MDRNIAVSQECVEPELLSPGGAPPWHEEAHTAPALEKPGLLSRLRMLLVSLLALLGFGLFFAGAILTSTIIGAIIGIPLLIAGAVVFFLVFLLTFGSKNTVVFRRF